MITLTKEYAVIGGEQIGCQSKFIVDGNWIKLNSIKHKQAHSESLCSAISKLAGINNCINYYEEDYLYKGKVVAGCYSKDFSKGKFDIIPLTQLFIKTGITRTNIYGDLMPRIYDSVTVLIKDILSAYKYSFDVVTYITNMLWLDCIYFNVDRHLNNIALGLHHYTNELWPIPYFDFGDALLSDGHRFSITKSTTESDILDFVNYATMYPTGMTLPNMIIELNTICKCPYDLDVISCIVSRDKVDGVCVTEKDRIVINEAIRLIKLC